ncbi:MAG: hypothetical protein R2822_18210 [Spirosomataceae bacterium]
MKYILTLSLYLPFFYSFAQSFPTHQQVIAEVKKYHGKLSSVQLNGDWQLVKEAGYTFTNTAKHPLAAITQKDANGTQVKIQGLAIYVRSGSREKWRFSRYFIYDNSREVIGTKKPTNQELIAITEEALSEQAVLVFNNCSWICWVYAINIPEPVVFQQQSANEMSFEVEIEYEERLNGMTERSKQIVEFNCRKTNGKWRMSDSMRRQKTSISQQKVAQNILDTVPGICDKPFAGLYGPQGPTFATQNKKRY